MRARARGVTLKSVISALRKDLKRAGLLLRHAWEFRATSSQQAYYSQRGELTTQTALRPAGPWTDRGSGEGQKCQEFQAR
jgi:hypothetical protein